MYKARFTQQKSNAKKRNIPFLFTYEQWLEVWENKITQRGHGKGKYCMARNNDTGPYSIDNVKIVLFEENNREQHELYDNYNHHKVPHPNGSRSKHYKTFPVEVIKKKEGVARRFECLQDAADFHFVSKDTIGRTLRGHSDGAFIVRKL